MSPHPRFQQAPDSAGIDGMPGCRIRRARPQDRPALEALLDDAIGRGFWDPAHDLDGIVLVAVENERVIGLASASVEADGAGACTPPVGHVRLVAVQPTARRRGIGTELVSDISDICESLGAARLVAYAWVYGPGKAAPIASALERAGYVFKRRIEGFYSGASAGSCPGCGQSPCVCPADAYLRDCTKARG